MGGERGTEALAVAYSHQASLDHVALVDRI